MSFSAFLICTLISETLRSALNLRKISDPANLDFFLGLALEKKARFINPGDKLKKNPGVQDLKIF